MLDYAHKYFAAHKRRFFIFKRRIPTEEMMRWTNEPIKRGLLDASKWPKQAAPPQSVKKDPIVLFKHLQMAMGDRALERGVTALSAAHFIVSKAIHFPELRDEVYVQICKQTHENDNVTSRVAGWKVMAASCCFFPPSRDLEGYLKCYLRNTSRTASRTLSRWRTMRTRS